MTNAEITGIQFADLLELTCDDCNNYPQKGNCPRKDLPISEFCRLSSQLCGKFCWGDQRIAVCHKALEALEEIAFVGGEMGENESSEAAHAALDIAYVIMGKNYNRESIGKRFKCD